MAHCQRGRLQGGRSFLAMAAALAPAGAQHVRWQTSEFAFDPYQLTAQRLPPEENTTTSTSPGEPPAKSATATAAAPAPVKRRPGRQKRTSVLCQVGGSCVLATRPGGDRFGGNFQLCHLWTLRCTAHFACPPPGRACCWVLQVPGCNEELVDAKKYYRRYRICAAHCAM